MYRLIDEIAIVNPGTGSSIDQFMCCDGFFFATCQHNIGSLRAASAMADDDEDLARQVREQQEQLRELQEALAEAQRLQTSMETRAEEEKKEDEETFDLTAVGIGSKNTGTHSCGAA